MRGITNAQGITGPHLSDILERLSLLENNPPVGSVTFFNGEDWLVVHWDILNKRIYLARKYTLSAEVDSIEGIQARLNAFDNTVENYDDILEDVSVFSPEEVVSGRRYAFIPTLHQISEEFILFRHGQYGNCKTMSSGNLVNYQEWCLSPDAEDGAWPVVPFNGNYNSAYTADYYFNRNETLSVRPFICMKMR